MPGAASLCLLLVLHTQAPPAAEPPPSTSQAQPGGPPHGATTTADASTTTTVLTDDPSTQELLGIQSVLGFSAVVALGAGVLGNVAGLWLVSNQAPQSYWDGKPIRPPLRIFFDAQGNSASVLAPLLVGLLLPLVPTTVGIGAMLGLALVNALATLDTRGRTDRRVVVRLLSAVALVGGSVLPSVVVLGALVVLPPLAAAAAIKQFYPVVAVSDVTRVALPYVHMATLGLLVAGALVGVTAVAVAALGGLGALLLT